MRTFVEALSGHLALSGQRWRLADVFWWRLADAVALFGHKWRLADIKQILALSGLSDAMALFSVFSIFARFPIIQPKRFLLCILTHTLIFYLMRVVLSRFYIFWVRLSPDRCSSGVNKTGLSYVITKMFNLALSKIWLTLKF